MYQIVKEGQLVALCDEPRYVLRKPETGVYIQTSAETADGVAVAGNVFPITEVSIRKVDVGAVLFEGSTKIRQYGADIAAFEDVLCSIDAVNEEA